MKMESEKVGYGLNIPGRVVGGDDRCKDMVRVECLHGWEVG